MAVALVEGETSAGHAAPKRVSSPTARSVQSQPLTCVVSRGTGTPLTVSEIVSVSDGRDGATNVQRAMAFWMLVNARVRSPSRCTS